MDTTYTTCLMVVTLIVTTCISGRKIILELQKDNKSIVSYKAPLEIAQRYSTMIDKLVNEYRHELNAESSDISIPISGIDEQVLEYLFPYEDPENVNFQELICKRKLSSANNSDVGRLANLFAVIDNFGDVSIQPVGINKYLEAAPDKTLVVNINNTFISRNMVWTIHRIIDGSVDEVNVRFQNVQTNTYLRSVKGTKIVDVGGGDGPWTAFKVEYHGDNIFTFKSVQFRTYLSFDQQQVQQSFDSASKFAVYGSNWGKLLSLSEMEQIKSEIIEETFAKGNQNPIDSQPNTIKLSFHLFNAANYFGHEKGKNIAKKRILQYLTQTNYEPVETLDDLYPYTESTHSQTETDTLDKNILMYQIVIVILILVICIQYRMRCKDSKGENVAIKMEQSKILHDSIPDKINYGMNKQDFIITQGTDLKTGTHLFKTHANVGEKDCTDTLFEEGKIIVKLNQRN